MTFKKIDIHTLKMNPFDLVGQQWILITAKKDEKINTMTASWGGLGVVWSKNVATVYIRPQRYTNEFVDGSDYFTLSFFDESYRKDLAYLGKVSGKDEDKISNTNLTIKDEEEHLTTFEEAELVFVCRKMYKQALEKECFVDKEVEKSIYPDSDYHYMYIGEIEAVYVKE